MLHAQFDSMHLAPGRSIERRQITQQLRNAASPKLIIGWLAVLASTGLSCLGVLGSIENFYEVASL